jgi:hypothetical protein
MERLEYLESSIRVGLKKKDNSGSCSNFSKHEFAAVECLGRKKTKCRICFGVCRDKMNAHRMTWKMLRLRSAFQKLSVPYRIPFRSMPRDADLLDRGQCASDWLKNPCGLHLRA